MKIAIKWDMIYQFSHVTFGIPHFEAQLNPLITRVHHFQFHMSLQDAGPGFEFLKGGGTAEGEN